MCRAGSFQGTTSYVVTEVMFFQSDPRRVFKNVTKQKMNKFCVYINRHKCHTQLRTTT